MAENDYLWLFTMPIGYSYIFISSRNAYLGFEMAIYDSKWLFMTAYRYLYDYLCLLMTIYK